MHQYAGSSAAWIANVGLVDDSDLNPAVASVLNVACTNLADRTSYLNAKALLKTGGVMTGGLELGAGGFITVDVGSTINLGSIVFSVLAGNFGKIDMQSGSDLTVDAGALIDVLSGGLIQLDTGAILAANGVSTIRLNTAAALRSIVPGGIQLAGGSGDWPTCNPARNRSWMVNAALGNESFAAGWAVGTPTLILGATAPSSSTQILIIPATHNGATLSSVSFRFIVAGTHANPPATMPAFNVLRQILTPGGLSVAPDSLGGGTQSPATPATGALWDASHFIQDFDYLCSANNVIDNSQYFYYVTINEETGANALGGNKYFNAIICNYTGINDMRFP
jgi:hypothetical protein